MSAPHSPHGEASTSPKAPFQPSRAHIVGSVPLRYNTEVYPCLSKALPTQLSRIPDGETYLRSQFVTFQKDSFRPYLVNWHGQRQEDQPEGPLEVGKIHTGYDSAAIESYMVFRRFRDDGIIPKGVRFQVSLPTPVNILGVVILPKYISAVEPLLEAEMMKVVRNVQDYVAAPHKDLAIQ